MTDELRPVARKGRGAISNDSGRYEPQGRVAVDDGWASDERDEALCAAVSTRVLPDSSRSIIARNDSPDIPFERSINVYRGCEHGCIYCYARPSHAWLGLSPGLDFETRIFAKHQAAELLRQALAKKGYKPKLIALGTNTDPYQPVERGLKLTRQILEVLAEARHPVSIVTKSHLVTRDLDLLEDLARDRLVKVFLSVTSLSSELSRVMEPRAARPERRLQAVGALAERAIPVGVMVAPVIPAINDHELEAILEAAASAGANSANYILVRLPLEIKQLFEEWLETHFPDRKDKVLGLIRDTRGGKLYDPTFGRRMRGSGSYAELLSSRFRHACRRLKLGGDDWQPASDLFRRPRHDGDQLSLF